MMRMSIPYERTGRTQQKARTRNALIGAARELLAEGETPNVERTADRAGISRATAVRYFPTLLATLAATFHQSEERWLLGAAAPEDPIARLDAVTEELGRQILEYEPELRTHLRLSLEPAPHQPDELPLRQGRAIGWIEDALRPIRDHMPERDLRRLVLAIRATIGIEPLVWLTDVGGVSREQAVDIMRSSARSLLRTALSDSNPAR